MTPQISPDFRYMGPLLRLKSVNIWDRPPLPSLRSQFSDSLLGKIAARFLKNQDDIGIAIKPIYGGEAGNKLAALLRDLLSIAADIVKATEQDVAMNFTEVWEIYNTTGDVHPMHFHLVNAQLINRQLFDEDSFPGTIDFTGPVLGPDDNEKGWKETIKMYPGTVTRIIMRFTVPKIKDSKGIPVTTKYPALTPNILGGNAPSSPRTGGYEYVWHCHILEHEEYDMMHALVVWP